MDFFILFCSYKLKSFEFIKQRKYFFTCAL